MELGAFSTKQLFGNDFGSCFVQGCFENALGSGGVEVVVVPGSCGGH